MDLEKTKIFWHNNYFKIIPIIVVIIVGVGFYFYQKKELEETDSNVAFNFPVNKEGIEEEKILDEELKEAYYYVDIKGAVTNPNVYKLKKESRIVDVIKMAGGLKKSADTSVLNLSKKITEEMVIIIYTKEEIDHFKEAIKNPNINEIVKYIKRIENCPDPVVNEACINNDDEDEENNISDKISINNASVAELESLPGIGAAKAQDIINYRNDNGPFIKIEDIKNVSGIGDSTFAKIKDLITL